MDDSRSDNEGHRQRRPVILHPVDCAAFGRTALARAMALARWHGARLQLVYVAPGSHSPEGEAVGHTRLRELAEAVSCERITFETLVLFGDPVTSLVDFARRHPPDLLILGRHAGRGHGRLRAGILAKELARLVKRPILMVPEKPRAGVRADAPFSEVLCPIGCSPASSAAFGQALLLARDGGGRLTLLHVLDGFPCETVYSGFRAAELLDEYRHLVACLSRQLKEAVPPDVSDRCDVRIRVVAGVPYRAILSAAAVTRADLIVMGLRVWSAFDAFLMRSPSSAVVRRADCPVLLVPVSACRLSGEIFVPPRGHLGREAVRPH